MFELGVDENLRNTLLLRNKRQTEEYSDLFIKYLEKNLQVTRNEVRLLEASLFLSMLPLHADHPKKAMAFLLKAIDILSEFKAQV